LIQQDGGVSFKDAWMHLTDEYPIKYEAERLPPPLVADLNGDGKKEVLVATHDAKIQVLSFPNFLFSCKIPCFIWFPSQLAINVCNYTIGHCQIFFFFFFLSKPSM